MSVPHSIPHPRANLTDSGVHTLVANLVAADLCVALGDYTGGAAENLFTLTAHGLHSGDVLHVLWQSALGAALGGEGTRAVALVLSSSTFQLTTDGSTVITNTADGTVAFLKGDIPDPVVQLFIIPNLICGVNDTTGGTVEDMMTAVNGLKGAIDGDTIKLLYKSAAGVAGTLDATVYVKSPVTPAATGSGAYFQTAATSGGAVVDTTADGTYIFVKTS